LTLDIQSLSTDDIIRRLKKQDLNLSITYSMAVGDEAYEAQPLFSERYVLIASEQTALPRQMSWAEVAELPLLSPDMQNRRMLDEIVTKSGARPNVVVETNAIRILHPESLSGRAFSVMPVSALPPISRARHVR
jgi:DNA-binding transcriptional LysR family regulator